MPRHSVRAFISGCEGFAITEAERGFFRHMQPWGLILFARNCQSPEQLKELTGEFRSLVGRKDAPVLIDQEGGRVQRMSPATGPWRKYPAPALFGQLYDACPLHALRAARNVGRLMAKDLQGAGINVDCLPVLDMPQPGSHAIISDRAYSTRPDALLSLARAHVAGLAAGGVLPVAKHLPGHGRATVDSHQELPRVTASRPELEKSDLLPFAAFGDLPMGMTCHVVFDAFDRGNPATLSRRIIRDVLRKQIGFQGLLMTDDLSMKALGGNYAEKTRGAIEAGCDVVLHCNGHIDEMHEVAEAAPLLQGKSLARAKAALRQLRKPLPFDEKAALRDLEAVMARAQLAAAA
jgi:beta-N-acetylhexosaminidase